MISVDHLGVEFNATPLLEDVSFVINKRDRIALVGKNGAGKSTLLRILSRQMAPSGGQVSMPSECRVGYLPQVMKLSSERTVREETLLAFSELRNLEQTIQRLSEELSLRTDYESEAYHKLIDDFTIKSDRYNYLGGASYSSEMERTLLGLGFERSDLDRQTSELSGGWRMRIELAKILLMKPDVLLLDEPTNHLDIESIQWLEAFLKDSSSALMLVSHDRAFLNNVTTRTIEISCRRIADYKVPYDQFIVLRQERREQQLRAYENQQKFLEESREFIERFRYKATKAVQVQSRIKQLEKIVPVEIDEQDRSRLNLKFTCPLQSGSYPVILESLGKSYGPHEVFSGVDMVISRGQKVAFVGKNGAGKSTLVKCLMHQIQDYSGKLTIGHNVRVGYFAQNQAQLLDESLTVFETVDNVATGDMRTKVRDILGAFMFPGEDIDKKVKVLSGGERTRLAMIRLLLEPVNLLILDEPTNHLDMLSKDVLKEAIRDFPGTAILVSHDRDFLNGLVDTVYEFHEGRVRPFLGGIYDFLEKKRQEMASSPLPTESLDALYRKDKTAPIEQTAEKQPAQARLDYQQMKERKARLKKLERRISDLETEISEMESAIAILEDQMISCQDTTIYEKHGRMQTRLESLMQEWEQAQGEMEEFES